MTIYEIDRSLFDWFEGHEESSAFVHQANCFHTMGAGIARRVRELYPELYKTDLSTQKGDNSKIGTISTAKIFDYNNSRGFRVKKYGINLYSQFFYGRGERFTEYDAVDNGCKLIRQFCSGKEVYNLGFPVGMGCNLAGGNWKIVRTIIEEAFDDSGIVLYFCNYKG